MSGYLWSKGYNTGLVAGLFIAVILGLVVFAVALLVGAVEIPALALLGTPVPGVGERG